MQYEPRNPHHLRYEHGKAPAEKKEAGKKTAAPAGDKKKRTKTRKETYSSYIYKGIVLLLC